MKKPAWLKGHGFHVLLIGLAVAGVATTAYANVTRKELLGSIGEALLVAVVLTLLVDTHVKRRFAAEVGRSVFLQLFGLDAPAEYVEQLGETIRSERLSLGVEWRVSFSWDQPNSILAMQVQSRNTTRNISRTMWQPPRLWLLESAGNTPGSRFLSFEAEVQHESGQVDRFSMNERTIADRARTAEGGVVLELAEALPNLQVPPGALYVTRISAITYQHPQGALPLILSHPAMRQELIVDGSARGDLTLSAHSGFSEVPGEEGDDSVKFVIQALRLQGHQLELYWKHTSPAVEPP